MKKLLSSVLLFLSLVVSANAQTVITAGDSIMYGIQYYLPQYMKCDKIIPLAKSNTGWCNKKQYDWNEVLLSNKIKYNPDMVVVLLGTNDISSITEYYTNGKKVNIFMSDGWKKIYTKRLMKFYNNYKDKWIVYVLPPPMPNLPKYDKNLMKLKNFIYEILRGKVFIISLEMYVQNKATDGIHYTQKGYNELAMYLADYLKKILNKEY